MIVRVSDILKDYGGKIKVKCDINLDDTQFLGEDFIFLTPISVDGKIVNNGKALEFDADCHGKMKVRCARCMKELEQEIAFVIHEVLAQDDGTVSHDEDIVLFLGTDIDISDIVINNFIMNVSGKYLCVEDCKGLCPICGADLNQGDCGCTNQAIDPRWAGLADIMKKNSPDTK